MRCLIQEARSTRIRLNKVIYGVLPTDLFTVFTTWNVLETPETVFQAGFKSSGTHPQTLPLITALLHTDPELITEQQICA